jgi:hypothetical protein
VLPLIHQSQFNRVTEAVGAGRSIMQAQHWGDLFRRVPLEAQNALLLGLSNGSEIAVQDLLRIDENFLLLRGRIGGTTDTGRLFCLPYQQLTFCCVTRQLPQELLVHIFGTLLHTTEEAGPRADVQPEEKSGAEAQPAGQETPPPVPMPAEPPAPATIRDRLRARLAGSGEQRRR